jgi:hypothetical protein
MTGARSTQNGCCSTAARGIRSAAPACRDRTHAPLAPVEPRQDGDPGALIDVETCHQAALLDLALTLIQAMLGPIVESGDMTVVQRRTQVLGAGEMKHLLDDVGHFPQDRTNGRHGSNLGSPRMS